MRSLITGPAGSGKTQILLEHAWKCAAKFESVTLIALPGQRETLLKRLSEKPSLGVRLTDLQTRMYEILEASDSDKGLLSVPARVALVARVLGEVLDRAAEPGEAALYALSIAELKRSGLERVPLARDPYQRILEQTLQLYNAELERRGLLDPDDVRTEAIRILETSPRAHTEHLLIDGYQTLNPMELRAIKVLSSGCASLRVTLPSRGPQPFTTRLLEGEVRAVARFLEAKVQTLKPRAAPQISVYAYPNADSEARATLGQVKAALLGLDRSEPADLHTLALIVPSSAYKRPLLEVAAEYGIPLSSPSQAPLLECGEGVLFSKLLSVHSRGYPLRDLQALSKLYGLEALCEALDKRGLGGDGLVYLERLEELEGQSLDLGPYHTLVGESTLQPGELQGWLDFVETLLERVNMPDRDGLRLLAREVYGLLEVPRPAVLLAWMRALLGEVQVVLPLESGVALLTPEEASGARFERVWLLGALEGSYALEEGEDFFFAEEERSGDVLGGLRPRMLGRSSSLLYDALWRGNTVQVSYPSADRGGNLRGHPLLQSFEPASPTRVGAASSLEHTTRTRSGSSGVLDWLHLPPTQENRAWELSKFVPCKLRGHLSRRYGAKAQGGVASRGDLDSLRRRMRQARWDEAELPSPGQGWSGAFAREVQQVLERGLPPKPPEDVIVMGSLRLGTLHFRPHAYRLEKDAAKLQIFIVHPPEEWPINLRSHPESLWLLETFKREAGRGAQFEILAWDLLSKPRTLRVTDWDVMGAWKQLEGTLMALEKGDLRPEPGFHCRGCRFADVCRVGT